MMRSRSVGTVLVLLAVAAATVVAVQSGPSTDTAGGAAGRATVALQMTVNRPDRPRSTARLTCRGRSATARGYLRRLPVAACRTARRIAGFLASRPSATEICTQEYGGPQTARIRGTIGRRSIDRRFARGNGCEISDWDRAGVLLSRVHP